MAMNNRMHPNGDHPVWRIIAGGIGRRINCFGLLGDVEDIQ
jgi:hypothetical protein